MLPYIHPVSAAVVVALLLLAGSLGLRARNDRRHAREHLRRHARLAPMVYWLVVASWIGGVASTWRLRTDLELASSAHFRIGTALVLAMTAAALSSRWMQRTEIRAIHPWFGIAAILLAAAQVFFGLQITP